MTVTITMEPRGASSIRYSVEVPLDDDGPLPRGLIAGADKAVPEIYFGPATLVTFEGDALLPAESMTMHLLRLAWLTAIAEGHIDA